MAKKKKKRSGTTFVILLMIIGYYIMTFPISANLLNEIYNQNTILMYNNSMQSYSDEDIATMFKNCEDYNEGIYEGQKTSEFHYLGPTATDEVYKSLPTASNEIGTLRIPDIGVNVAFAHGTNDSVLQAEAGHLYGTSLPIEGENVHSVIAAHSALSTAKLFTDLNKLKKGAKFYVTVLNQKYEYKVDQIKTVLPEDDYKYEQIEDGKNYVTLYTCTPYGVNTHRLLVRGEYVGKKEVNESDDNLSFMDYMDIILKASGLALIILGPFILMVIYAIKVQKDIKKKNGGKGGKSPKKQKTKAKKSTTSHREDSIEQAILNEPDNEELFLDIDRKDRKT